MPNRTALAVLCALCSSVLAACAGAAPLAPSAPAPELSSTGTPARTLTAHPLATPPSPSEAGGVGREQASGNSAVAALAALEVKGRAPMTGYARAEFGPAWTDDNNAPGGHNGCDTRNDILRRDLTMIVLKAGSNGCTPATGTLHDPYTARWIRFVRGAYTSSAVQIDHVVALGNAWQSGAQQFDSAARVALANDPLNLLAVDGPTNEAKGDANAASWLPPNKAYRCAYVARQAAVKARYRLAVTQAEHDAIARVLATCPTQKVPVESGRPAAVRAPAPTTQPGSAAPTAVPSGSVSYRNCAAVRAAGNAPLYVGQPGYSRALDRDGDGVACE